MDSVWIYGQATTRSKIYSDICAGAALTACRASGASSRTYQGMGTRSRNVRFDERTAFPSDGGFAPFPPASDQMAVAQGLRQATAQRNIPADHNRQPRGKKGQGHGS